MHIGYKNIKNPRSFRSNSRGIYLLSSGIYVYKYEIGLLCYAIDSVRMSEPVTGYVLRQNETLPFHSGVPTQRKKNHYVDVETGNGAKLW